MRSFSRFTLGEPTGVNTFINNYQEGARVVALAGGGHVVVWESAGQDGSGGGIYARLFDAAGVAGGPEFRINTTTAHSQHTPEVVALADGGFVVGWSNRVVGFTTSEPLGVTALRFDARGQRLGEEYRIKGPELAVLGDGTLMSVWTDRGGVYGQRYDPGGQAIGAEFQVASGDFLSTATATALNNGEVVVAWRGSADGAGAILTQRYDASGGKVGAAVAVATGSDLSLTYVLTPLAGGGHLAVWARTTSAGSTIEARRFGPDGRATTASLVLETAGAGVQLLPAATALANGGFALAWTAFAQGSDRSGYFTQRFSAEGLPDGPEDRLLATRVTDGRPPAIAALPGGDYVVAYAGFSIEAGFDVLSRTLTRGGIVVISDESPEVLVGSSDDDLIQGQGGDDRLFGGSGRDDLSGGAGADLLNGEPGDDTLAGGTGDDLISGETGVDRVLGEDGDDVLLGGPGNDVVEGGVGNDILFGEADADRLLGGAGSDIVNGMDGDDLLEAGDGADVLSGEIGADVLIGGVGADVLIGGGGADRFLFLSVAETQFGDGGDLIVDFERGLDVVDLSALDADTTRAGDQAFVFVAGFTGVAGQATLTFDAATGRTVFRGDVNGDGIAEVVLSLLGQIGPADGFVL